MKNDLGKDLGKYIEHTFRFNIPVFLYSIKVIFSNNVLETRTRLNDKLGKWPGSDFMAMHSDTGGGYSYIILPLTASGSLISHEAFHCVTAIMGFISADLEEEVVAYTLSYIVEKIERFQLKKNL